MEICAAASPNLARIKFCVEIEDGAEGGRELKAPLNAADNEGTIGALLGEGVTGMGVEGLGHTRGWWCVAAVRKKLYCIEKVMEL